MSTAAQHFPVLDLRVVAGDVELRGLGDEHLAALGELAVRGVHAADAMPFYVPWTQAPAEELPRRLMQFHWGLRAAMSPEKWDLELGVWFRGELVGVQGIGAQDFPLTRTAMTGSWLGLAHQGRGIGTAMRQAVCAFGFDHLGARTLTSGAWHDNPASLAVSRKVGYVENGVITKKRGNAATRELALLLTPEAFVRGADLTVHGADAVRAQLGIAP